MNVHKTTTQTSHYRAWIRLVVLYLLFPIVLLSCSGDLFWWQGWCYSIILFIAGVYGRALAEQRHPGLMDDRQDIEQYRQAKSWDKLLAPLMALSIGFPLQIVAGLDHRFQWSIEFSVELTILGLILTALGYAFAVWALIENRFFLSVVRIQTERGHKVCDTGPYQYVRHPGYAGNVIALFGIVLALSSLWTFIPVAVALIITLMRTHLEDQALRKELTGYEEYTQRVHYRLIPWVY